MTDIDRTPGEVAARDGGPVTIVLPIEKAKRLHAAWESENA